MTVDGIDFYISDTFGEELYDSCKDVKFGTMNTRAIEFVGGGAKSSKGSLINMQFFVNMECLLSIRTSYNFVVVM